MGTLASNLEDKIDNQITAEDMKTAAITVTALQPEKIL